MQGWIVACITLIALLMTPCRGSGTTPCSAFCSTCNISSANPYLTCVSCPSGFYSNSTAVTTSPNCTYSNSKYGLIQWNQDVQVNESSVYTCGSLWSGVPGVFGSAQAVTIWETFSPELPYHFKLKVRVSVVFLQNWAGSDYIHILFNSSEQAITTYGSLPNLNPSLGCNISSPNRYGIIDTGDILHTDIDISIILEASTCNSCPGVGCQACGWIIPDIFILSQVCHPFCSACYGTLNTNCTACTNDTISYPQINYLLYGNTCGVPCPSAWYQNGSNTCDQCQSNCSSCVGSSSNCTACLPGFFFLPFNTSCVSNCPDGYYLNLSATPIAACQLCDPSCKSCTAVPMPCLSCFNSYYLFGSQCLTSCPDPYVQDSTNWVCQDCAVYCVNMTLTQFAPSGGNGLVPLMVDLNFTFALNWTNLVMANFQSIVFYASSLTASNFNITYLQLSPMTFRITIQPYSYAFISNQLVKVSINPKPTAFNYTSTDSRPFMKSVFNQSIQLNWTYMRPPNMTATQYSVVSTLSTLSTSINQAFSGPGFQEIKKFGFLLLILNSMQMTSCLLLLNTVLPQNIYEGIRFFASLIFFDVPEWQAKSSYSKYFLATPIQNMPSRRLLSVNVTEQNFKRTGFSGVFVYDTYSQIFLILLCYMLLGVSLLVAKAWKRARRMQPYFYTSLDAFHEIAIMYFTLTMILQMEYFQKTTVQWTSLGICLFVNIYYLGYQLRVYYALIDYSIIPITSARFQEYAIKYAFYLKYIRFDHQESVDSKKCGLLRHLFRPHNYHVLSYIKKVLMMITFPLFFRYPYAQILVLIFLQTMEIIRLGITRPYTSRLRNISRIVLELVLLSILVIIFVIQLVIVFLSSQGQTLSTSWAGAFYLLGWIGFGLIYVYNLGFVLIFCLNWYNNFTKSNKQLIEDSRRVYYFQLLNCQEENNRRVPMPLLNEWILKGNLNARDSNKLPQIDYRIEQYIIQKMSNSSFIVDVKAKFRLAMDTQFNFKQQSNNLVCTDQTQAEGIIISLGSPLYKIINELYETYSESSSPITVKTFLSVDQSSHKYGQSVQMANDKMHQVVQTVDDDQETKESRIKLTPGFPISKRTLELYLQPQR